LPAQRALEFRDPQAPGQGGGDQIDDTEGLGRGL